MLSLCSSLASYVHTALSGIENGARILPPPPSPCSHVPPGTSRFWFQSFLSLLFMSMLDMVFASYAEWGYEVNKFWRQKGACSYRSVSV